MAEAGERRKRTKRGKKNRPSGKERKARASSRHRKKPDGPRRICLISAINHPVRRRILRELRDSDEPRSPAELARAFRVPIGTISYHTNVLRRLGALKPAGERQVRGAVEHFYDSTIEGDPPIEALLDETREVDEGSE
jgi:DNA-binding transcriptional ArsR family regulator